MRLEAVAAGERAAGNSPLNHSRGSQLTAGTGGLSISIVDHVSLVSYSPKLPPGAPDRPDRKGLLGASCYHGGRRGANNRAVNCCFNLNKRSLPNYHAQRSWLLKTVRG